MERPILMAYATKHESTHEVAESIAEVLRGDGLQVDVRAASDVTDLGPYAAAVVGGALYMGRWHRDARHFLRSHREALAAMPVFVFGMGPLDLEDKSVGSARGQLEHALGKVPEVQPRSVAIFGGVVHPDELHFPFSRMPETDARDPEAIRAWAQEVAADLTTVPAT
jgi:menaquinone-dependent protoporphyrinogen oxidase